MRRLRPTRRDAVEQRAGGGEAQLLGWCRDVIAQVGALEAGLRKLSDAELAAQTNRLRSLARSGESLDALLPEAFATVREAAVRTLGQRHYDVQVMGGAIMHLGNVAEMRTGEGKTLAATLPAYLNSLSGDGVHVLTANEYLASRDAEWMRPVYEFLSVDIGLLRTPADTDERRAAYLADVTYGVAEEFCYDFLRDNLAYRTDECVQRGHNFAIVDEADLIMIDAARSLPQMSVPTAQNDVPYPTLAAMVARLQEGVHYTAPLGRPEVILSDEGARAAEDWLGVTNLYDSANLALAHALQNALLAVVRYQRERDYIVVDGTVVPLDPVSGRADRGRTLGEGLLQAVQAKEGLTISPPREPMAIIATYEYLRGYRRLAGMTGTAESEAASYREIYGLDVVVIPTNRPMIRIDDPGPFYGTRQEKLRALAEKVAKRHAVGQPVLIGAGSIPESTEISALLNKHGIAHEVLTAQNNEREAELISCAGRLGAVTIIAKMAGRGVDIVLGGPDASSDDRERVADAGGLCVLGAERYLNRRMEMHLRGRAGRQGDPGESELFASFEDEAVIAIAGTGSAAWNKKMLTGKDAVRGTLVTGALARGQANWAAVMLQQVKQGLEFDVVLSGQRREIYVERQRIFTSSGLSDSLRELTAQFAIEQIYSSGDRGDSPLQCKERLLQLYPTGLAARDIARITAERLPGASSASAEDMVTGDVQRAYRLREAKVGGAATMRRIERYASLRILDHHWQEHLQEMAALLDGIGLRAIGGRSPLAEYRRDAGALFQQLLRSIRRDTVRAVFVTEPSVLKGER
jgi:preprotein translocase subunit SecA